MKEAATSNRLIDAKGLLKILFADNCRPSLRWFRTRHKLGQIPSVRIGRLVFFDPDAVRAALADGKASNPVKSHRERNDRLKNPSP